MMPSPYVLVLYYSRQGGTAKMAQHLARILNTLPDWKHD